MITVDSINFAGKRALIRVDFNVPLTDAFKITDDSRMTAVLPTIQKILNDGGKSFAPFSMCGSLKSGLELRGISPC